MMMMVVLGVRVVVLTAEEQQQQMTQEQTCTLAKKKELDPPQKMRRSFSKFNACGPAFVPRIAVNFCSYLPKNRADRYILLFMIN
jgi:hypothetical protein